MTSLRAVLAALKEGSYKLVPTDFTPFYQYERWHKAKINARLLRLIRKEARICGVDPESWGCPPEEPSAPMIDLPPKGTLNQRLRPYKQEYIRKLMEEMPQKIAQWKEVKLLYS